MMIHQDQQNVEALCEHADFIDSGFQSFNEQVKHLTPHKMAEAAFFAGAGLAFKLQGHFDSASANYPPGAANYLLGLVCEEINEYMETNRMRLEWEPHVPGSLRQ
jgi:hypothetical protein